MSDPVSAHPNPGAGLSLRFDAEQGVLHASVVPDPAATPIDEAWLRDHLAQCGHGQFRYLAQAATALLASYNSGQAITVTLAECVDAAFRIEVTPDGLEAHLLTQPAEGGKSLERGAILAALADRGIGDGVLAEAIDAAVASGAEGCHVIARGLPPRHGRDGWLEPLIPEARNRAPRVDETGHADYRDLGEILVVHEGDRLMRRQPPTRGTEGRTLLGESIEARDGKDAMYSANLPGTAIDPDNPDLLLAAITGQPVIVAGGMMVEPVFRVETVGTASGNIDFDGSVTINGDVMAGMTVRASGDIHIGGVVEMATLEAGGGIVVKGGVMGALGRKNVEEHHIRCGACFTAAYAQQARIEAGDSIFIDDLAMQCELSAVNHVVVGDKGRGHLIGGHVQATLSITAKTIGSPNRVRTVCEIGVNPLMHKQLLEMSTRRDGLENQLLDVSKLLDFARKNPGKLKPEMIEKARATAAALSPRIAELRAEQEVMTKKIDLSLLARVTVLHCLHDGGEVHMGNQCYRAAGDQPACAVGLGPGGLGLLLPDADAEA